MKKKKTINAHKISREADSKASGCPQPLTMIDLLLNSPSEMDKEDAAMDLEVYDQPEVEAALISVILDPGCSEDLMDTATESLITIWLRQNRFNRAAVKKFPPYAKKLFVWSLAERRPEWVVDL